MMSAITSNTIEVSPRQLADVALSTIRSALGRERYQYLSAPITGGHRLLDWHRTVGRQLPDEDRSAARRLSVTTRNIADVIRIAEQERASGRRTIEPGSFEAEFEQWGQPEYYAFWNLVLERHANRATFVPGWHFSAGCSFEYLCARRHGIPTVGLGGEAIGIGSALTLIDEALRAIDTECDRADLRDASLLVLHDGIAEQRRAIAELG